MERKYYIDYIHSNTSGENFYFQLVRREDEAILYANRDLTNIFARCFEMGINKNDVTIL